GLGVRREGRGQEQRRNGGGATENDRRQEGTREQRAQPDPAMEQQARHPEPEGERAEQPGRDEDGPTAGVAELGLGDDDERERARKDEEEGRVQALVGSRADLDLPGARVDVLVELA